MNGRTVIDSDGHVRESIPEIHDLLDPRWQRKRLYPVDAWDRSLQGTLGIAPGGPDDQLAAMAEDSIDVMVMYPTTGLHFCEIREPAYAVALARAYDDWVHRFCQADPARLKFAAMIPVQDVKAAVEEVRRSVTELGAVGVMVPTYLASRPDWGHEFFDPIYAEAERLDVPIAFHPAGLDSSPALQRFDNFLSLHAIGFPVDQMMAMTSTIVGGVYERFPGLRIGFLEAGAGWVPYFMDRLDEEVEKRGAVEAPYLTKLPSEYMTGGQMFFGVECEERTIADAVRWGLEDTLLYSSDYPHWDSDWPDTVEVFEKRDDLSDEVKTKILHDNAARFYGPRVAGA